MTDRAKHAVTKLANYFLPLRGRDALQIVDVLCEDEGEPVKIITAVYEDLEVENDRLKHVDSRCRVQKMAAERHYDTIADLEAKNRCQTLTIEKLQEQRADLEAENTRLREALEGAIWVGSAGTSRGEEHPIGINVFSWQLPNCDGRLGDTPVEALE